MDGRKLRDAFLIFLVGFVLAKFMYSPRGKKIDLPEEWTQVKQGDTLRVYRINKDTIFIGYYNGKNR